MQEVELTAILDPDQLAALGRYLGERVLPAVPQRRFMIRFFRDQINASDPLDIRYKWTNGQSEIVTKAGGMGIFHRREITVSLAGTTSIDEVISMFQLLGFNYGVAIYREFHRYLIGEIEFTVVSAGSRYYVEAEILTCGDTEAARSKIEKHLAELGLTPLDTDSYLEFISDLDRKVNVRFALDDYPDALIRAEQWRTILSMVIQGKEVGSTD